jgi:hypothetical protein
MSVQAVLYDFNGNQLAPVVSYGGVYPVIVRQSAATAAPAIVWALWNPTGSGKVITIRAFQLQMFFDGTAVATLMKYEMIKYTGVTAFGSGTVVSPLHKRTALSGALVGQARVLDTGMALTGGAAQVAIPIGAMGRVTQTTTAFASYLTQPLSQSERGTLTAMAIELAPQEAFVFRQTVASVIGDNLVGYVETGEV